MDWSRLDRSRESALAGRSRLEGILGALRQGGVLVAFSGGVDSTYLLYEAHRALGDRCEAALAVSESLARLEHERALDLAASLGVTLHEVHTQEMEDPDYLKNSADRCYFCKRELFTRLAPLARERGLQTVAYGAMADDVGDHRPGTRAAREAEARAPLLEAGLGKNEIRWLSREAGLPNWHMPAQPCLASRFAYGHPIENRPLRAIEEAEILIRSLGVRQVRVRHHGNIARIEVEAESIPLLASPEVRTRVVEFLEARGYLYVTLDLSGFTSGRMNLAIDAHEREVGG